MILTAHQPVYLPWCGLFHKIAQADTFCLFDMVQYLPKDWNNRNKIKNNIWLTVPVKKKGHRDKPVREIEIDYNTPWIRKHLKSLYYNYHKAPFYDRYIESIEMFLKCEWKYLTELNEVMLRWFIDMLNIDVNFVKASNYEFEGKKNDLVLDMCKKLGATKYIFGEQGHAYADVGSFKDNDIELEFQHYTGKHRLSIVDVLFNYGDKSMEIINA